MERVFTLSESEDTETHVMPWPKRNRQTKVPVDVTCRQCGTTTTPVWRKGPYGPHT